MLKRGLWPYLLMAFLCTLTVVIVTLASMFKYSSLESECYVSKVLQWKMREKLSKAELMSARPEAGAGACPTLFFYKSDAGGSSCADGHENIFRGPEIGFGSCG